MKLIGSFSILMFFICSVLSFGYMYVNNDDDSKLSFISSSKFLEIVEDFPRENFDSMLNAWENIKESAKYSGWQTDEPFITNIAIMLYSIGNFIVSITSNILLFIVSFIGYAFDIILWILDIPYTLLLN